MHVTNPHAVSRLAKRTDAREPLTLTPAEAAADALLRFENCERYRAQSAKTQDGARAELPPRARLHPYEPDAPDFAYFHEHSYADLAGGF